MKKTIAMLGLALSATGCVSHFTHSMSASTSTQGTPFQTKLQEAGILSVYAPDLDVTAAIREKCPAGKVSNVETQGLVRNWFGIVQIYTIDIKAICTP